MDPTGTPLNVRASPNGHIVGTLRNGVQITVLDHASDQKAQEWVYVGRSDDQSPIGWVYRRFIACATNGPSGPETSRSPTSNEVDSLPEEYLGIWETVGSARTDNVQSSSNPICTGEVARITKNGIDWDALGFCRIDHVENELSHLPDADPSYRPSVKVTLSCDGMYRPLKDTQIWYALIIDGESFMTQVTAGKLFQTYVLRKCKTQ
jgi:hypothetical protein